MAVRGQLARVLRVTYQWRHAAVTAAVSAYAALIALASDSARPDLAALTLFPASLAAGLLGLRAGLACAMLLTALDVALAPEESLSHSGVMGHAMLFAVTAGAAWLRTMVVQAQAQAALTAALAAEREALAAEREALRAAEAEAAALRRLGQLKDELMRTVSHELRTPLSYVYGYSELLASASDLTTAQQLMAQEVHRAAAHMRQIVDDLMELNQLEDSRLHVSPEPVRLQAAIPLAVTHVRQGSGGAAHRYVVEVDPRLPDALVDSIRLEQVLVNLLTNASRYSSPGTTIRVAARTVPAQTGQPCTPEEPVWLEVAVHDDGVGLTAEQCTRVFEKFYRGDVRITGKHPGAGLGLSICRALVEAHGGLIWAESPGPGQGAVFRFTLPAETATVRNASPAAPVQTSASARTPARLPALLGAS